MQSNGLLRVSLPSFVFSGASHVGNLKSATNIAHQLPLTPPRSYFFNLYQPITDNLCFQQLEWQGTK